MSGVHLSINGVGSLELLPSAGEYGAVRQALVDGMESGATLTFGAANLAAAPSAVTLNLGRTAWIALSGGMRMNANAHTGVNHPHVNLTIDGSTVGLAASEGDYGSVLPKIEAAMQSGAVLDLELYTADNQQPYALVASFARVSSVVVWMGSSNPLSDGKYVLQSA